MSRPDRVFLVPSGYNFRAVLAFCRALRASGMAPSIIACTGEDPIFRTEFASDVVLVRTTRQLVLIDFIQAAQVARKRAGADRCVLAPVSEYLVRWALGHRAALAEEGCELPLPEEDVYRLVSDKASFTEFCRRRELLVPEELTTVNEAALPCVAKPRWNIGPDGSSLYPWLLLTPEDLGRFKNQAKTGHFFFQKWIEGRSFYLFFYLSKSGVTTRFSQENLAQQQGGKSIVLARAGRFHLSPEADRWESVLREAGFHGLVMLELRESHSGWVLIEANPRLWGPLQLCVDACPALIENYISEYTGEIVRNRSKYYTEAHYLWLGGTRGAEITWHGRKPRFPKLRLVVNLLSDVYMRRGSTRQFFHEYLPPVSKLLNMSPVLASPSSALR